MPSATPPFWTLTAWCETLDAFHVFRVDLIKAADALPELSARARELHAGLETGAVRTHGARRHVEAAVREAVHRHRKALARRTEPGRLRDATPLNTMRA